VKSSNTPHTEIAAYLLVWGTGIFLAIKLYGWWFGLGW